MPISSHDRFLNYLGYGIGALILLFNLVLLWPELSLAALPLNDDVLHFTLSRSMADSLREGENVLDPWIPYGNTGFPVFHYYPFLPHLITGLLMLILPWEPLVVFNGLKLLLLLLFPAALYVASRSFGLPVWSAWMAAACGASIAAPGLYGLDYQSYLWNGFGLYGQLWGAVLLPLVLSRIYGGIHEGRRPLQAALLMAALILSHAVYAWMAFIFSAVFLLFSPVSTPWRSRILRMAGILIPAVAFTAFFWLPHLLDRQLLNRSVWEPAWKYDSYGADFILRQLLSGSLFDQGRLPLTGLLLCCGLGFALRKRTGALLSLSAAFLVFVVLSFGRPTWGIWTSLWPLAGDMHLHRLIGGIQLSGVFLAGCGFGALLEWCAGHWRHAAPIAGLILTLAVLGNAAWERSRYYESNRAMMQRSLSEAAAQQKAIDGTTTALKQMGTAFPGRIYAGLGNNWGKDFAVGYVPWYARLTLERLDNLGYLYQAMPLVSDIQVLFNDHRYLQYDLFNIRHVLAPAAQSLPQFLSLEKSFGAWNLYSAPTSGYIGLARSTIAFSGDRRDVFPLSSAWLNSPYLQTRNHPALFLGGRTPRNAGDFRKAQQLADHIPLPPLSREEITPPQGLILSQNMERAAFTAEISTDESAVALLKAGYHPNWKAFVDGAECELLHLVPGFMGVRIGQGRHRVEFRYRPGWFKAGLLLAGMIFMVAWFRLPKLLARRRTRTEL